MPVKVTLEKDKYAFIYPTAVPQKVKIQVPAADFKADPNFYIFTEMVK